MSHVSGTQALPGNLGEILVARRCLAPEALERAQRLQQDGHDRLDRILTRLGLVTERALAEALAALKAAEGEIESLEARIAELEAETPDCAAAVKAERERVVDALVSGFDLLATSIR